MFTIYDVRARRRVKLAARAVLVNLIAEYEKTPEGSWLRQIPWRDMQYYWCDAMTESPSGDPDKSGIKGDVDVMGAFDITDRSINLQAAPMGSKDADWAWIVASTAVHELRHAWQMARFGAAVYAFAALPLWRNYTLEPEAYRQMEKSEELFSAMTNRKDEMLYMEKYRK